VIPPKAIFVICVLISGLIFSPSYSFAQSNQDDNPLSSLFEFFRQLFSFDDEPSEPVIEFGDATIVQTSGTSSTTDTTENNLPPMANAGPDQDDVMEFATVTLDGSSSTDLDGEIVSYKWTQLSGAEVTLSSMSDVKPIFTAPDAGSPDNILKFMLAVVDNSNDTDTDEVIITVNEDNDNPDNENSPPIADAGPDQTVMESQNVTLDGSDSTDLDGEIVSYKWTQLSGAEVTLSSMSDVKPTFTAPDAGSPDNILKFMLAVVDNSNDTDTDEVIITVNEDNDNPGDGGPVGGGPGGGGPDNGNQGNGNAGNENSGNDNEQEKVTLCHVPPGNPAAAHTITVGAPAVDTHLDRHDDYLGPCVGGNNNGENNENKKSNSGKGNKDKDDDEDRKGNSGKGNKDDNENKSNSGKDKNDDKKDNSGKGNSDVNNSGKGNQNDKDENKKSNSEKGNKSDNEHKSNSKLKNNNDDEAKDEDNEHEEEHDDEDEDEHEDDEDEDEDD